MNGCGNLANRLVELPELGCGLSSKVLLLHVGLLDDRFSYLVLLSLLIGVLLQILKLRQRKLVEQNFSKLVKQWHLALTYVHPTTVRQFLQKMSLTLWSPVKSILSSKGPEETLVLLEEIFRGSTNGLTLCEIGRLFQSFHGNSKLKMSPQHPFTYLRKDLSWCSQVSVALSTSVDLCLIVVLQV